MLAQVRQDLLINHFSKTKKAYPNSRFSSKNFKAMSRTIRITRVKSHKEKRIREKNATN